MCHLFLLLLDGILRGVFLKRLGSPSYIKPLCRELQQKAAQVLLSHTMEGRVGSKEAQEPSPSPLAHPKYLEILRTELQKCPQVFSSVVWLYLLTSVNLALHLMIRKKQSDYFFVSVCMCFLVLIRFRAGAGRNILLPWRALGGCQGRFPLPEAGGLCKHH